MKTTWNTASTEFSEKLHLFKIFMFEITVMRKIQIFLFCESLILTSVSL